MVLVIEVRPNLLSGELERFLLKDVSRVNCLLLFFMLSFSPEMYIRSLIFIGCIRSLIRQGYGNSTRLCS